MKNHYPLGSDLWARSAALTRRVTWLSDPEFLILFALEVGHASLLRLNVVTDSVLALCSPCQWAFLPCEGRLSSCLLAKHTGYETDNF